MLQQSFSVLIQCVYVCVCFSAMNDLLQTMAVSEGQWSSSTDHLEAPDGKEFGSMDYSSAAAEYANLSRSRNARHHIDTGRVQCWIQRMFVK